MLIQKLILIFINIVGNYLINVLLLYYFIGINNEFNY
jgi:hypothetical protein